MLSSCYCDRYSLATNVLFSNDLVMGIMMDTGCAGVWCDIFDRGWINDSPRFYLLVVYGKSTTHLDFVFRTLDDHQHSFDISNTSREENA
jgi:hypothetical protein